MTFSTTLSEKTKKLLQQLGHDYEDSEKLAQLMAWFDLKEISTRDKKNKFLLESLKASLMKDIQQQLKNKDSKKKTGHHSASTGKKILFGLGVLSGILIYLAENMDSSLAILSLTSLTAPVVLGLGFAFSLISLIVFFAFDLGQVANTFGVKFKEASQLVDCYVQQLEAARALTVVISKNIKTTKDPQVLADYDELLDVIEKRYKTIDEAREKFELSLNRPKIKLAKKITTALIGIFYAAGGYFLGSSLYVVIAGLLAGGAAAAGATFFPALCVGIVLAAAAYFLFLSSEGSFVKDWVGSKLGLDKEKIELLADKKAAKTDKEFLKTTRSLLQSKVEPRDKDRSNESRPSSLIQVREASDSPRSSLSSHGLFALNPSVDLGRDELIETRSRRAFSYSG